MKDISSVVAGYCCFERLNSAFRCSLCGVLLILFVGCEPGGGVAVVPTVTLLPSEVESTDVSASNGGTTASDPGVPTAGSKDPGTLKGRVSFEGTVPQLAPLVQQGAGVKDAEVCAAVAVPSEKLRVAADGGVQDVFVYLSKAPSGAPESPVPSEPAVFDQKGCRFLPHAMLVRVGQTLQILSADAVAHNTHTNPAKNNTFNQVISANDRSGTASLTYARSEAKPFPVTCDFHAWMMAYHLPLDHPYAAITGPDGSFEIQNLPAGTHKFQVWHESADGGYVARNLSVKIKPGDVTEITIPYPQARVRGVE